MTDDKSNGLNRRAFVKRAAATSAITLGAAGGATGSAGARTAPVSRNRADHLLDAFAADVLSMLEADGVLADRADLPTEVEADLSGIARDSEGSMMLSMPDRPTELRVVKRIDAGTLTVGVRPDDGHAFALLETDDGTLGYDAERGRYDFGTVSGCNCIFEQCSPYPDMAFFRECCFGGDCTYECVC